MFGHDAIAHCLARIDGRPPRGCRGRAWPSPSRPESFPSARALSMRRSARRSNQCDMGGSLARLAAPCRCHAMALRRLQRGAGSCPLSSRAARFPRVSPRPPRARAFGEFGLASRPRRRPAPLPSFSSTFSSRAFSLGHVDQVRDGQAKGAALHGDGHRTLGHLVHARHPPTAAPRRSIIAALCGQRRLPARVQLHLTTLNLGLPAHASAADRADFLRSKPDDPAHLARGLRVRSVRRRNSASRHAPASSRGPRSPPQSSSVMKGHGGVQQDQALVDDPGHRRAGLRDHVLVAGGEKRLGKLEIPDRRPCPRTKRYSPFAASLKR